MRRGIRRVGGVVVGAVLAAGLAVAPASAEPDRAALQHAMDELTSLGAAGIQLRVHDAQGDWVGSSGVRTIEHGGTVPTDGRFRVGSITKTFVSTVVLQLVDEGALTLEDPIGQYIPEFGIDSRITVRMLLQHTSGLFNYTGEPNPDGSVEAGIPVSGQEFVDNRYLTYAPSDLVEVALAKPPRFEPGTQWSYSNTNYVLLGMLIEKLTGNSYADEITDRIIRPLHLRHTYLPGTRTGIPGPHAHGYLTYPHDGAMRTVDITRENPSWASSAGEIIATTADLDRFLGALFDGKLLPADLLAEMRTLHPQSGYGLGLQSLDAGPDCGGVYEGHTGGVQGYQSFLFRNDDGSTAFAASVTTGSVDVTDPEAVEKLSAAMNKILEIVTCGADQPGTRMELPAA
jgi:D-alanyl-D-alanine carboxypeptidase